MLNKNEQAKEVTNSEIARPLGRVTARELNAEEVATVSGGWTFGLSNLGGANDKDLIR
jgi:hypothetical protein